MNVFLLKYSKKTADRTEGSFFAIRLFMQKFESNSRIVCVLSVIT
jgi:hypothetical protein